MTQLLRQEYATMVSNNIVCFFAQALSCQVLEIMRMILQYMRIRTLYSTTFYTISGSEKNVILSNSVTDTTGGTVNVSGDLGQISGASTLRRIKIDDTNDLNGTLYFELTTKDKYGTENVYQLQMALTEITKNDGN